MITKRHTITGAVLGFTALLVWSSLYVVDERQLGVVTRFGEPLEKIATPGLHGKMPWPIDRVLAIDSRVLFTSTGRQELLTVDQKNLEVEGFLLWRVTHPKRFVETLGNRLTADARIVDIAVAKIGASIGKAKMSDLIGIGETDAGFHTVVARVKKNVNDIVEKDMGILITDFQLSGLNLLNANRPSVIQRMQAERAKIAAGFRAEGEELSLKIEAEAAAAHDRILGAAHAEADKVLGRGQAKALAVLGEAYKESPEFFRFIRNMENYETIMDKKTTIFLETNSKLLKALNGQ